MGALQAAFKAAFGVLVVVFFKDVFGRFSGEAHEEKGIVEAGV